jgi:DNA polymerase III subunit epsilon
MAAAEDLPQDLVFVDLETTGGNAAYDRITEVGIVRIKNGELIDEWSSLVNPERPIPAYIEAFTGINDRMVAAAPRFADIAAQVREKLHGAVFVAHNARFDYSFLRSEFLKANMSFSARVLCTVKLSRRLFPEYVRHNLDAVMERNGLSCSARHRALGDARVLHDLWFKLRRDVPEARLAAAVQLVLGAHRLPAHLPAGLADELPEGPGVYRFFGEDDVLLYVGKSKSLRTRVCDHFAVEGEKANDRRLGAKHNG